MFLIKEADGSLCRRIIGMDTKVEVDSTHIGCEERSFLTFSRSPLSNSYARGKTKPG